MCNCFELFRYIDPIALIVARIIFILIIHLENVNYFKQFIRKLFNTRQQSNFRLIIEIICSFVVNSFLSVKIRFHVRLTRNLPFVYFSSNNNFLITTIARSPLPLSPLPSSINNFLEINKYKYNSFSISAFVFKIF